MTKIVVIGGGWAGVSAAVAAKKAGADVIVLERADMLLGTGLVGGIMRNNGRFTAAEEAIAMGGGDVFQVIDANCRHTNVDFPGHKHASLYDIAKIEPAIREMLLNMGIEVRLRARVKDAEAVDGFIHTVTLDDGEVIDGDVFVETTGSAGPMNNCTKYGNGCAMCVLRCPTFGGRISIAAKIGIKEMVGKKADGTIGAMSGSGKLLKESLSKEIVDKLEKDGVAVIPLPEHLRKGEGMLGKKACQQYALKEFAENIILLDTGHAKIMSPYYPLDQLRQVPGFENARFDDPYAGGIGNSMRFLSISPRDDAMHVFGAKNLFCGGEKAGLFVGHTEAIVTGTLAGYNAVRYAKGLELLVIPESISIGDAIAWVNREMKTENGMGLKYTFSGSTYFKHMQELGLYTTDIAAIKDRVEKVGMTDIYCK